MHSPPIDVSFDATPRDWHRSLGLVERHLSFNRRRLHAGDPVQVAGEPFRHLHLIRVGAVKSMLLSSAGSLQMAGLHIQGDWVGFDGLSTGVCACDAVAMDTSEVWTVHYLVLQKTAERVPEISMALQAAMGRQIARERDWRLALATLPADLDLVRRQGAAPFRDTRCRGIDRVRGKQSLAVLPHPCAPAVLMDPAAHRERMRLAPRLRGPRGGMQGPEYRHRPDRGKGQAPAILAPSNWMPYGIQPCPATGCLRHQLLPAPAPVRILA